jgi:hypothetical protein
MLRIVLHALSIGVPSHWKLYIGLTRNFSIRLIHALDVLRLVLIKIRKSRLEKFKYGKQCMLVRKTCFLCVVRSVAVGWCYVSFIITSISISPSLPSFISFGDFSKEGLI